MMSLKELADFLGLVEGPLKFLFKTSLKIDMIAL